MTAAGMTMMFNGYSDRASDSHWILARGEPVHILELEGDYGARVCGLGVGDRPARHRTEWVWLEELSAVSAGVGEAPGRVSRRQVTDILSDPSSKAFKDLRDRAAYMYITRCYPTHLRPFFTGALTEMRRYANRDAGRAGFEFELTFVHQLELDDHPMVERVRELVGQGWRVDDPIGANARHSFQKVHLSMGDLKRTIRTTGEVVLGWQPPKVRN